MAQSEHLRRIETIRRFNRFYTAKIGVLREGLLDSQFSLTEGRVVYELAHHETTTAAELAKELAIDTSYLSRILKRFEKQGLIQRWPSAADGRENSVSLTEEGQAAFAVINGRSRAQAGEILEGLSEPGRQRLISAIQTIEDLLGDGSPRRVPYILRPHQPGDIGWVIQRHGMLYAQEYGFDETFEGLVAEVAAAFIQNFNPARERCWIAERDGENVGSVFLVKQSDEVAKLRLLLVEPQARGLGIGQRLVEECIRFARLKGYGKLTLWTNDCLHAAIAIYRQAGFVCVDEEPHRSFGQDLVGQTWELAL